MGRGSTLLLNVPPDRRGLINEHDSAALVGFRKLREQNFNKPVTSKNIVLSERPKEPLFTIKLGKATSINCVVLKEPIKMGQKIKAFIVQLKKGDTIVKEITGTTVGRKRILSFSAIEADTINVAITDSKPKPSLSDVKAYLIDERLIEK